MEWLVSSPCRFDRVEARANLILLQHSMLKKKHKVIQPIINSLDQAELRKLEAYYNSSGCKWNGCLF